MSQNGRPLKKRTHMRKPWIRQGSSLGDHRESPQIPIDVFVKAQTVHHAQPAGGTSAPKIRTLWAAWNCVWVRFFSGRHFCTGFNSLKGSKLHLEVTTSEKTLLDSNVQFGTPPFGSSPYEISAQSDVCREAIEPTTHAFRHL